MALSKSAGIVKPQRFRSAVLDLTQVSEGLWEELTRRNTDVMLQDEKIDPL